MTAEPKDGPLQTNLQSNSLELALEEYRQVVEDRRYVMTRYIQALGLYLALAAFALKELVATQSQLISVLYSAVFTVVNMFALYAARRFKSMALHALNREQLLADRLQFQGPHSLIWGYAGGVLTVLLFQLALILIVLFRWYGLLKVTDRERF